MSSAPGRFSRGCSAEADGGTRFGAPRGSLIKASSQLQGGGIYCAYNVKIVTKPQTAASTGTRISPYLINGLVFYVQVVSGDPCVLATSGSVRDSSDTVDIVYNNTSGAGLNLDGGSACNFGVNTQPTTVSSSGTITNSGTAVTGTGTNFGNFTTLNSNNDISLQMKALGYGGIGGAVRSYPIQDLRERRAR